jgi:hypothetical protein
MGSISGSVGADGGVIFPPPSFINGIKGGSSWVVTSIYDPTYPNSWTTGSNGGGYIYTPFEYGWRAFVFQLLPGSGSSAATVTISATNDYATAANQGGTAWETVMSASGAVFPNPLVLNGTPTRLLYINSGPWTAFRATASGSFPGGVGAYMLFGAAS